VGQFEKGGITGRSNTWYLTTMESPPVGFLVKVAKPSRDRYYLVFEDDLDEKTIDRLGVSDRRNMEVLRRITMREFFALKMSPGQVREIDYPI
jgi:hypothetical protein